MHRCREAAVPKTQSGPSSGSPRSKGSKGGGAITLYTCVRVVTMIASTSAPQSFRHGADRCEGARSLRRRYPALWVRLQTALCVRLRAAGGQACLAPAAGARLCEHCSIGASALLRACCLCCLPCVWPSVCAVSAYASLRACVLAVCVVHSRKCVDVRRCAQAHQSAPPLTKTLPPHSAA